MKKMCMLIFALMSSVAGFTQVSEVKGVETKLVVYNGPEYSMYNPYAESYYRSTKWFGYSFYNMNSIPVSVEAELYKKGELVSAKTFNLKSNETYIWKHEDNNHFMVNWYKSYVGWTSEKLAPGESQRGEGGYFIKYKAYKIL